MATQIEPLDKAPFQKANNFIQGKACLHFVCEHYIVKTGFYLIQIYLK